MIAEDVDGDLRLRVARALVELVGDETGNDDPVHVCFTLERLPVHVVARLERLAMEDRALAVAYYRRSTER